MSRAGGDSTPARAPGSSAVDHHVVRHVDLSVCVVRHEHVVHGVRAEQTTESIWPGSRPTARRAGDVPRRKAARDVRDAERDCMTDDRTREVQVIGPIRRVCLNRDAARLSNHSGSVSLDERPHDSRASQPLGSGRPLRTRRSRRASCPRGAAKTPVPLQRLARLCAQVLRLQRAVDDLWRGNRVLSDQRTRCRVGRSPSARNSASSAIVFRRRKSKPFDHDESSFLYAGSPRRRWILSRP
jgi:hypothetical protein